MGNIFENEQFVQQYDHFRPAYPPLWSALAPHLGFSPGKRVIDVACGVGADALHLQRTYGMSVQGIDISARMCEEARKRLGCEQVVQGNVHEFKPRVSTHIVVGKLFAHHVDCSAVIPNILNDYLLPGGRLAIISLMPNQVQTISWVHAFPAILESARRKFSELHEELMELQPNTVLRVPLAVSSIAADIPAIRARYISFLEKISDEELERGIAQLLSIQGTKRFTDPYTLYGTAYIWTNT